MQDLTKRAAHGIHLILAHRPEERERQAAIPGCLRHREFSRAKRELVSIEGLKVDRRKVRTRGNTSDLQLSYDVVPIVSWMETHDVDKPADPRGLTCLDE